MQLLETPRFQPGDTVRFVGRSREPGLAVLPGTLGSIVSGPLPRRTTRGGPERMAYQVLFGYHTGWVPADKLEAEQ